MSVNINNFILNKKILYTFGGLLSGVYLFKYLYKNYCINKTFNRLDNLFPRTLKWEQDLSIYSVAMPIFRINNRYKRKKCVLFISGYRDTPFVWNNILNYFVDNKIDFYAPRTFGKGRSFFQDSDPLLVE